MTPLREGEPASSDAEQPRRSEIGDTLIELLIAIGILGIVAGAILLAFSTAIVSAAGYRNVATMDTVLRTAAAQATSQIQQEGTSAFTCPANDQVVFSLPSGYSASAPSVSYWSGTAATPCTVNAAQLVTVTVTHNTTSQSISFGVDNPANRSVTYGLTASKLVFLSVGQPDGTAAGSTVLPVVAVEDSAGNIVTSDLSPDALTILPGTGPHGASLSSTCAGNEFGGVITYQSCSIALAGVGYQLLVSPTAQNSAVASGTSAAFTVTPGAAAQLVFTASPGNTTSTTAFAAQPAVTIEDAFGNTVVINVSAVTLAIANNPAHGTLACNTNPVSAVTGVASFAFCNIDKAGVSYTLVATDGSLTAATSPAFNITVGTATQLIFSTAPGNGTGGSNLSTQPVVTVEDAGGNPVVTNTSAVTLAIATNPSGGTLNCNTSPLNAIAGIATFAGCDINKAGTGYTLTATGTGLTASTSPAFNITVGPATQLGFTTSPGNGAFATTLSTQPVVTVEDAGGNPVTSATASVTLAVNSGTGTLACTTNPVATTSGVATFAGCKIPFGAQGTFTLSAAATALSTGISNSFTMGPGPATQVVFSTPPGNGTGGTALSTQPVVTIEDAGGNTVVGNASAVTLTIFSNPSSGTLTCNPNTNVRSAVAGIATFTGCKIDKAGSGYALMASDGSLTAAITSTFNITVGPATQLGFTTPPSNGTGGTAFATQPVVAVEDAGGNTVVGNTSAVSLAIAANPSSGTLTCNPNTNVLNAVAGIAAFVSCNIDLAGTGYSLTATATGLTAGTSPTFNITVGPATQLQITTSPSASTGGTAFGTQPVVTVQDAGGNTVTASTASVTLAVNSGTGTLTCTTNNTRSAVNGVAATFAGCKITLGTQGTFTLKATATGLATDASNSFTVAGAASKLAFTTVIANTAFGTVFNPQPVIAVEDSSGDLVTTSNAAVTIGTQTGNLISGTCNALTVSAVNGVATFAGCVITSGTAGSFSLNATSLLLSTGISNTFTMTAGPATQLQFTTSPGTSTHNIAFPIQPVVTVEDAGGNTVTGDTSSVVLAINFGGGTLTCTSNPVSAVSGVATFAGCRISTAGFADNLSATDGTLTPDTSNSFRVS